jgi:proton-dependent oligopeptide transporter, POT family
LFIRTSNLLFIIYAQTFSTLVIFAKNNIELNIFGFDISPASFTSVSYFWILTLSPLLAKLYIWLNKNDYHFNTFDKFATAIFLCGLAFLILYFGCVSAGATAK